MCTRGIDAIKLGKQKKNAAQRKKAAQSGLSLPPKMPNR
jgi:hypothetical protein